MSGLYINYGFCNPTELIAFMLSLNTIVIGVGNTITIEQIQARSL